MTYDPNRPIPARPTIYCMTQMRSRAEARFAGWIDQWCVWDYEPFAVGDPADQWLPDFRLHDVHLSWSRPADVWVDVKPLGWMLNSTTGQRRAQLSKMSAMFSSAPEAVCIVNEVGLDGPSHKPGILTLAGDGTPTLIPGMWVWGINARPMLSRWASIDDVQPALAA